MQHIYLTRKIEQLKEKEKKLKINFLTMTSVHRDTHADLESHGSTHTSPAVLWGWILQEGSKGMQTQRPVPSQEMQ